MGKGTKKSPAKPSTTRLDANAQNFQRNTQQSSANSETIPPTIEDIDEEPTQETLESASSVPVEHLVVNTTELPQQQSSVVQTDSSIQPPQFFRIDDNLNHGRQQVRMPPFNAERPDMWFIQLEAGFALANVTSDLRRYNSVITQLDPKYLIQFQGIIRAPPTDGTAYEKLKAAIIERFADTEAVRLRRLLGGMELGDRRPSHLLEEMRELSSGKMDDSLLIQIWKQRLPQAIQEILSGSADNTPSTELARIADRIRDVEQQRTVNAVQTPAPPGTQEALIAAVQLLVKQIEKWKPREHSQRENGSQRSRQRRRSNSNTNNRSSTPARTDGQATEGNRICWYHRCYGNDARNCTPPCSFRAPASSNQQP